MLSLLHAGRLEGDDSGLGTHVSETLRQRLVLRTEVGQSHAVVPCATHPLLIKGRLGFRATQSSKSVDYDASLEKVPYLKHILTP